MKEVGTAVARQETRTAKRSQSVSGITDHGTRF